MTPRTHLMVAALVAGLVSATPLARANAGGGPAPKGAPAPAAPKLALDAAATKTITDYMGEIEALLARALAGDDAARKDLIGRALAPKAFQGELERFVAAAGEQKATQAPRVTGAEMLVTMWFGIVPVRAVRIYLWRTGGALRVAKLTTQPPQQGLFGGNRADEWDDAVGPAFGKLASQLVEAATQDRCASVPLIERADYEPYLPAEEQPRRRLAAHLERDRYAFVGACNRLRDTPYNRVTWRLGQLGAAVLDDAKQAHTFRVQLIASRGDERRPALLHVTPPVAPPSSKDKQHVRAKRTEPPKPGPSRK